ncbi:hypothetical protein MKX03_026516 [Papaver bracteatum]|nr:hypothetical protein MKX03_026516 [Papaver bracteatum]
MVNIRNHQLTENDGSVIMIFARGGRAVTREEIRDYFRSYCRTLLSARVVFYSMSTFEYVIRGQGYVLLVNNGTLFSVTENVRRPQPIDVLTACSSPPAHATPEPEE